MANKKSTCINCESDFIFDDKRNKGLFCKNECQGEYSIKQSIENNRPYTYRWRPYLRKVLGEPICQCGQGEIWNGKTLVLQIDHIDGNRCNNQKENLRWICPNCHTQTETWGIGNISEEGKSRLKTKFKNGTVV